MIDIIRAKEVFKEFIKNYDVNHPRVKVKIAHTYRVSEIALQIAKAIGLSEEEQRLAELIGLLHDIGRFEQIRIYNTYLDFESIDHATQGLITLFEDGYIRKFIEDEKYDNIIYKAIENHNKYKIQDGLEEKELLHCKIIRDADKLDIFNVVTTEDLAGCLNFSIDNIENEKISDDVYEKLFKKELISYADMRTNVDQMVVWVAYMYDLNFKESFRILKEKNYIEKIVNRVEHKDIETRERMKKIQQFAEEYLEEKIK